MFIKKIFFSAIIFCVINNNHGLGQSAPKIIPPSPDVAAIQKYGDIPIGTYTGTPNISIPLYEIKSGDISVPISINYNASGIRVSEEASRTGLGWVLSSGGVISRNIVGKDDFNSYHTQTDFEIPLGKKYVIPALLSFYENCLTEINGYQIPQVILNNFVSDFQPDQYNYNFNGHSGKFVLRRNKEVILNKTEKIAIKLTESNGKSWQIKTADGFLYQFEDIEINKDNTPESITSWYLSKIISPTGKIVQFIYVKPVQTIQSVGSFFEWRPVYILTPTECSRLPSPVSSQIPGHTYQSVYLSKIIFDQGEVLFNYIPGRVDIANDVQLDNIKVYTKNADGASSSLIKSWKFNYNYFTGSLLNSSSIFPDAISKRLKLISVEEVFPLGSSLPPYSFSYNENINDPSKNSFARDHWGYYNGKTSNGSLIPTFIGNDLGAMGNERSADPAYSQMFILKKINYPTGGFTKFEYESNDFDEPNSIVNDYSYAARYTAAIPVQLQATISPNAIVEKGGEYIGTLDLNNMYPARQDVKLEAWFINYSNGLSLSQVNAINYSIFDPAGMQIGGGQVSSWLNGSATPPMTEWISAGVNNLNHNMGVKMTLIKIGLTRGIYTFKFDLPPNAAYAANIVASYRKGEGFDPITNNNELVYNAVTGGGIRIKRIADYTSENAIPKIRKYNYYYKLNGKTFTYGRRMAKPNYSYYDFINVNTECKAIGLMRESDSNIPLNGSTNAVAVGYDKVEELMGENGENGKIVYEYVNAPDIILDYSINRGHDAENIPIKPPYGCTMPNANNGSLLKQTSYANVNGAFIKINEVNNQYNELSDYYNSVVYGIEKRQNSNQNVPGLDCGMLSFLIYPALTINRPVLSSSVSKTYDISGINQPLTITTDYTYDNSTHLQLTSKAITKSNGDKLTTYFKYPADFTDAESDATILQMKGSAYMHALPITQQSILTKGTSDLLTAAQINKYQLINNKVFAKENAILETTIPISTPLAYNPASGVYPSGYNPRLIFDNYDAAGNILQLHKSNDSKISYLWGYNHIYPIAEITGASYAEALAALGQTDENLSYLQNLDNTALTTELNKLRTNLKLSKPLAQVATYTYTPLVGIQTQTDPNGKTIYYEYDGFQRLKLIKDQDGNIVKKYCYNYANQQIDCDGNSTAAQWQTIAGSTRCKPCPTNPAYSGTGEQEHQEKDNNSRSTTYNQIRWVNDGVSTSCPIEAWQNTSTPIRCKKDALNNNTGEQEQEQKNMNPCSATYDLIRWLKVSSNATACPPPPCGGTCNGIDIKCINNACEQGHKIYLGSNGPDANGVYRCYYAYDFSDGSTSQAFTEYSFTPCLLPIEL